MSRSQSQSTSPPPATRPPLPPLITPNANFSESKEFLIGFCRTMTECSPDEARQEAAKLPANGKTLYAMSEKEWKDLYGIRGKVIYITLQASKYGRGCSPLLFYFLHFLRIDYNKSLSPKYLDLHMCSGKGTWGLCSLLLSHPSLCPRQLPQTLFQYLCRNQCRNLPMWICVLPPRIHHQERELPKALQN